MLCPIEPAAPPPFQVRDEFRIDYDPGRGGFGKVVQKEIISQQQEGMAGLDADESPAPQQGDSKRRRTGGQREREPQPREPQREEEENPRFRGRRSDDEDEQ